MSRWPSVVATVTIVVGGCTTDEAGTRPRTPVGSNVTVGLDTRRDAFSFANFTAADTEEHFDVDDLKSMFGAGSDVCLYGDSFDCTPTPEAAAFARMVNMARSSGHCEGLVVRAAELFGQRPPTPVAELDNNGEVTHGVIRTFATQLFGPVRRDASDWASRSLAEIVVALENSISTGTLAYTMGLYTQSGGHTVLPIAVTRVTESLVRVAVYDPNWPGQSRHVDIDIEQGRWLFSFDQSDPSNDPTPWVGGRGDIDLVSLASRRTETCPFCGDRTEIGGALLLLRSTGSDWTVRTRGGVLAAGSSTEVAGVVRPVRAGRPARSTGVPRDYLVDVADATRDVVITLASSTRLSVLWPTAMVEVEVLEPSQPVEVRLVADRLSISGGRATVTVSRGLLGLEVTGDVIEVEHSASRIVAATPDGAVLATVDAAQKTNSSSMTETFVVLPEELRRTTDVEPAQPTPSTTVAPTPARGPKPDVLSDVARVSFDLTGWKPSFDDDGSLGFVTVDVLGTVEDDAQPCRTMRCLADKVVWLPRGGYDDETGELVLSPYRFEIVGVRSAFEIRCGRRGGWTSSRADTSGHSARCVFDSVEGDVVISLRST